MLCKPDRTFSTREDDAYAPARDTLLSMRTSAILIPSLVALLALPLAAAELTAPSTADRPPRKVIVGTAMQRFWGEYPGLQRRLAQLTALVDEMSKESRKQYGRDLDLAILPETSVTGETSHDVMADAVPLQGALEHTFAKKAREHHCYIVIPTYLLEDKEKKVASNAAILMGRNGEVVGIYRKVHLAVHTASDSLEGGTTPGKESPVFQCDFGKLGIQICYDMEWDYGWSELARQGAELVAWPSQSPQTTHPAARAIAHRYYIVSSTWRHNASFFEPTGKISAQIREPAAHVLVQQLDLSYAILPWSPQLHNGAALKEKYGDRVGFRYYEDEDRGIFWSNDPQVPIGEMIRSLGLGETDQEFRRIRKLYQKAGVPE